MSAEFYLSNGSLNWLLASSVPALVLLYLGMNDVFSRDQFLRHGENRKSAPLSYNSLLLMVVAVVLGLVSVIAYSGYMLFSKS